MAKIKEESNSFAERGIYYLIDNELLDKKGNPKQIEIESVERAKNLIIFNNYRYTTLEVDKNFWSKELSPKEDALRSAKLNKAELQANEIKISEQKQNLNLR